MLTSDKPEHNLGAFFPYNGEIPSFNLSLNLYFCAQIKTNIKYVLISQNLFLVLSYSKFTHVSHKLLLIFEVAFLPYLQEAPALLHLTSARVFLLFLQRDLKEETWPVHMLLKVPAEF